MTSYAANSARGQSFCKMYNCRLTNLIVSGTIKFWHQGQSFSKNRCVHSTKGKLVECVCFLVPLTGTGKHKDSSSFYNCLEEDLKSSPEPLCVLLVWQQRRRSQTDPQKFGKRMNSLCFCCGCEWSTCPENSPSENIHTCPTFTLYADSDRQKYKGHEGRDM